MTTGEVERALKENIGKTVFATTVGGESFLVSLLSVDFEGFTFRIVNHPEYDPAVSHWSEPK